MGSTSDSIAYYHCNANNGYKAYSQFLNVVHAVERIWEHKHTGAAVLCLGGLYSQIQNYQASGYIHAGDF
jgi:hypothetical protein